MIWNNRKTATTFHAWDPQPKPHLDYTLKAQEGDKLDDIPFRYFRNTLPSNLADYRGDESYDLRRGWELYGKPANMYEAWRSGFIAPVPEDSNRFHGSSVGPEHNGVMEFIKAKNHPTLHYELDWYNSPDAKDFRNNWDLVEDSTNYYKYRRK